MLTALPQTRQLVLIVAVQNLLTANPIEGVPSLGPPRLPNVHSLFVTLTTDGTQLLDPSIMTELLASIQKQVIAPLAPLKFPSLLTIRVRRLKNALVLLLPPRSVLQSPTYLASLSGRDLQSEQLINIGTLRLLTTLRIPGARRTTADLTVRL